MKPLEKRVWFAIVSLAVSAGSIAAWYVGSGLALSSSTAPLLLFAVLGLDRGIAPLLALALIRCKPALGVVR